MLTPLVLVLAVIGAAWGFAADRIAARWPAHDDGSIRPIDWRTPVSVAVGAVSLALVPVRFPSDVVAAVIFGVYVLALVLLLATDLDQRLLPNEITLPAIPFAFLVSLLGFNPLVTPSLLPIAAIVAVVIPPIRVGRATASENPPPPARRKVPKLQSLWSASRSSHTPTPRCPAKPRRPTSSTASYSIFRAATMSTSTGTS